MPIEVFQISNLIWDNGSYRVPNSIPTVFEDRKVLNDIPHISSREGGNIPLRGGHWNYCKYKGVYYFLKRERPLNIYDNDTDIKKQRWLYYLVRDHWVNAVLTRTVTVTGDLATWNLDKELEANLNATNIIIENPNGLARVCLDDIKGTWKTGLETTVGITRQFEELVINRTTINFLKKQIELVQQYKKAQKYIYPHRKDLFILGSVKASTLLSTWKNEVAKRVNKALKELKDKDEAILAKVNYNTSGNKLAGHYCFTYSTDAIGSKEDGIKITTIDLSNTLDIKRIDWDDLDTIKLDNILNEQSGIFETERREIDEAAAIKVFKLSRRNLLPHNTKTCGNVAFTNWAESYKGQKLRVGKTNTYSATLYWVDKIDFFLSWYKGELHNFYTCRTGKIAQSCTSSLWGATCGPGYWKWTEGEEAEHYGLYGNNTETFWQAQKGGGQPDALKNQIATYMREVWGYCKTKSAEEEDRVEDFFEFTLTPRIPLDTESNRQKFLWTKFQDFTPSYGILLFQIKRPWQEWRQFEYTGEDEKETLEWYSGIDINEFGRRYSEAGWRDSSSDREWWRRVNNYHPLANLCERLSVSRMYLDLWQLNFLHFLPTPRAGENYEQEKDKRDYDDVWGLSRLIYESKSTEVAKILDEQHLKDLDGKSLENPWTRSKYKEYARKQQEIIDKVFLRNSINIGEKDSSGKVIRPNLKKGDYLISDLEYEWGLYDTSIWESGNYSWIDQDKWEIQSFNLLGDFLRGSPNNRNINLERELGWNDQSKPQLLIIGDLDGKISFRKCYTFEYIHRLADDSRQWVKSVDGATTRKVKYYHFTSGEEAFDVDTENFEIPSLLASFYSSVADLPIRKGTEGNVFYWHNITLDTLDNPEGNLFDLVGTDWCVFIRGGYTHFIYKKSTSSLIQPITSNIKSFKFPGAEGTQGNTFVEPGGIKELTNLPLTAKINQINTIIFKTHPAPIKTRFTFKEDDSIQPNVEIEGIKTDDKIEQLNNHYIFKFISKYDHIEEPIIIPKEPVTSRSVGDQIAFDQLRLENLRAAEDYDIQKRKLGLQQEITESTARRALIDLNVEDTYRRLETHLASSGLIEGAAEAVAHAGASWAFGGEGAGKLARVGVQRTEMAALQKLVNMSYNPQTGLPELTRGFIPYLTTTRTSLKNEIWHNAVVPEKTRRIEEDKNMKLRDMVFQSYQLDLNHHRRKQDNSLLLNKLANQWVKDSINDVFITKKWLEKYKLTEVYMLVRYPRGEQLDRLKEYRDEYGIDIDLPNQTITLRSGMTPNIIRMRNIDNEGIIGVEDLWDRDFLKNRLEAGIKIFDVDDAQIKNYDYFDSNLLLPNYVNSEEYEREIKELQDKVETLENEATKEDKQNYITINYLLKKIQEDYNNLEKLKKDLEETLELIAKIDKEPDKYSDTTKDLYSNIKKGLEAQIQKAEQTKTNIEQKDQQINTLTTQNTQLQKDNQTYSANQVTLNNTIAQLRGQVNDKTDEYRRCQNSLEEERTKRSAAETEQNRLREQIRQKDTQISNLRPSEDFANEVGRRLSEIGFTDGNKKTRFAALIEAYKLFQQRLKDKERIEQEKDRQIRELQSKVDQAKASKPNKAYVHECDLFDVAKIYTDLNVLAKDIASWALKVPTIESRIPNEYAPSLVYYGQVFKLFRELEEDNSGFTSESRYDNSLRDSIIRDEDKIMTKVKAGLIGTFLNMVLRKTTRVSLDFLRDNEIFRELREITRLKSDHYWHNAIIRQPPDKTSILETNGDDSPNSKDKFLKNLPSPWEWEYEDMYVLYRFLEGRFAGEDTNYNGVLYYNHVYYDFEKYGGKTLAFACKGLREAWSKSERGWYTWGNNKLHTWSLGRTYYPYFYNPNQNSEISPRKNTHWSFLYIIIFIIRLYQSFRLGYLKPNTKNELFLNIKFLACDTATSWLSLLNNNYVAEVATLLQGKWTIVRQALLDILKSANLEC